MQQNVKESIRIIHFQAMLKLAPVQNMPWPSLFSEDIYIYIYIYIYGLTRENGENTELPHKWQP